MSLKQHCTGDEKKHSYQRQPFVRHMGNKTKIYGGKYLMQLFQNHFLAVAHFALFM